MLRMLVLVLFLVAARQAHSAIDLPMQVHETLQKFHDGSELAIRGDGQRIVSVQLTFEERHLALSGPVFEGLDQPDLSRVDLKLVTVNRCENLSMPCNEYRIPMIEIPVMGIPGSECIEAPCLVRLTIHQDGVHRTVLVTRAGTTTRHPEQVFVLPSGQGADAHGHHSQGHPGSDMRARLQPRSP
ncbi:hypothetical protein LK540_08460 [Massilia sp. IC2-278]|uniref:hypothetical protein n=1 Tax=Massilia sp. IC2-278 TaxID=2887200 RepID=UPI001E3DA82F|nr:hypothetical protein [Massilia sp. IC2-278]MCC2960462.1 hypothetical protein [Massilia sp. IC2-278]